METIVRSALGAYLQTCQLAQLPFTLFQYTTLNEKLNINVVTSLPANETPFLQYLAIGNGGHEMVVGANNITVPEPVQHQPTDAALYNQIPFVLRLPTNDLTTAQQTNYRLRANVVYGGVTYVAYYLKTLDLTTTTGGLTNQTPSMLYNTVSNGTTTSTAYTYTAANLNPTPPTGSGSTTGNYISATAKLPINFTTFDINELLNVANIIYGSQDYAIISELALCSGLDGAVSGTFNGVLQNYTEAMAVQVMTFMNTFYPAVFTTNGINLLVDVGAVEPLFSLT